MLLPIIRVVLEFQLPELLVSEDVASVVVSNIIRESIAGLINVRVFSPVLRKRIVRVVRLLLIAIPEDIIVIVDQPTLLVVVAPKFTRRR